MNIDKSLCTFVLAGILARNRTSVISSCIILNYPFCDYYFAAPVVDYTHFRVDKHCLLT